MIQPLLLEETLPTSYDNRGHSDWLLCSLGEKTDYRETPGTMKDVQSSPQETILYQAEDWIGIQIPGAQKSAEGGKRKEKLGLRQSHMGSER